MLNSIMVSMEQDFTDNEVSFEHNKLNARSQSSYVVYLRKLPRVRFFYDMH